MALIEGIGDEVLQFFLFLLLLLIAVFAWWSTKIAERPITIFVIERRQRFNNTLPPEVDRPTTDAEEKRDDAGTSESAEAVPNTVETVSDEPSNEEAASAPVEQEDVVEIRNRRLAFFEENVDPAIYPDLSNIENVMDDSSESSSESLPATTAGPENKLPETNSTRETETPPPDDSTPNIRIRLKYLNDDSKLVEGRLEERLGDFKRRHFSPELSGRNLVRLIFKGQVLGQDTFTLGHYGLFDNCVVHCLVHQARTPPPSPNLSSRGGSVQVARWIPWALSNILLGSLSLLLCLAWYGRYQYAQLYSATTTVALVGLTGIFTVSIIGIYMPEPPHH